MAGKKKTFTGLGADILKNDGPKSMAEFMAGGDNTHNHKTTEPVKTKTPEPHNPISTSSRADETERLHMYIRGDLKDLLIDEVARRRKLKTFSRKNGANERAIVEEALIKHFGLEE
jgi:hypothetical protein